MEKWKWQLSKCFLGSPAPAASWLQHFTQLVDHTQGVEQGPQKIVCPWTLPWTLSEVGRWMHFSLPPPPVLLSASGILTQFFGRGWVRGALLSHFTGWQCLLIRHRSAQSSQTGSSPSQRGHSCNAAAKCRELLSPLTVKGSMLGWVKASVYHPQRLMKHRVHCPEPPSMGQSSCLLGAAEHSSTGHLGVKYYWESTLTKITAWTGALWSVCPTSIAKELHLLSFPDLYQSLRSDFFYLK